MSLIHALSSFIIPPPSSAQASWRGIVQRIAGICMPQTVFIKTDNGEACRFSCSVFQVPPSCIMHAVTLAPQLIALFRRHEMIYRHVTISDTTLKLAIPTLGPQTPNTCLYSDKVPHSTSPASPDCNCRPPVRTYWVVLTMISNVGRVRGGNVTRVGDWIRTHSNQQDVITTLSAR